MPWTGLGGDDNFRALQSLDWQAHIYGDARDALQTSCQQLNLPLHRFEWNEAAKDAGIKRDALYLIRPDGYVAFACSEQDVDHLKSYVSRHALRFEEIPR
jgi:hypothetical protein